MDQGIIASLLQHPLASALVIVDRDGRPLAANPAAREHGLPATLAAYAPMLEDLRLLAADGGIVACTLPGGPRGHFDGHLRAVHDGNGQLLAFTLSVPEPVPDDAGGRWALALDSAGHGLWDWDIPSDRVHRTPVLVDDGGTSADTAGALFARVHPDDLPATRQALDAHLAGQLPQYSAQFRFRQADGQYRWVLDRGRVVARTADGQPLRVVGTHTDIEQQKQLESLLQEQQLHLSEAQRIAAMGSWAFDPGSRRFWWSPELRALFALHPGIVPGERRWLKQLHPRSRGALRAAWRRLWRDGRAAVLELELGREGEATHHLRLWMQPLLDTDGQVHRLLGQVQNITEQHQTDALIRWRTELLNRVSALGRIGGCEIEVDTRHMQWTEECYRIHGLRKEPITLDQALSMYTQDSRDAFEAALARISGGGLPEQLDLCFYRQSGIRVWVQVLVELDRRDGLPPRFVVLFRDITREREANERIELLAHYDLLTGLPNRMLLREQTAEAIEEARDRGTSLAMLFIDLDGFKTINDSFGHATGDTLLKAAAARLHQNLRNNDLFGRFSGDEFIVVLRDLAEPEDAGHVARKLIASLAEPLRRGDTTLKVGASVGIAMLGDNQTDFETLLRAADAAMYAAKEAGRNTYQYYSQDALARIQRRLEIEHGLHGAVEREEFSLVYQPLLHAAPGQPPAIEALLRWHRPGIGYCSPAEFIPIAEKCGEIVRIGDWVLGEACRQAAAWDRAGLYFDRVAVNVSAVQLRDRGFAERVIEICHAHGWPPQRLELELTESALIRDTDVLRHCFDVLERHGVPLAVDDFGTGFSNLNYLNRFPVGRLKIDRSFVQGMLHDAGTAEVTQAIVHLGHALGMKVTAEGVETAQEEDMLRRQGCDEIQGYLYSRPLTPRDLAQFLRQQHPAPMRTDASGEAVLVR
ncbi:bifunctional diguanylate cyclase/phosphodiesterase [Stenotrophomonas sp. 24(2023)]|uniref:bifunctional diguanylate cyclase/phosphodiesterase n=1 Tax=Stenotrophomonas sp. 24(2023) TaxID=3068324 RepID=UPI0027E1A5E0|nr:bifunctional diguanylate cyclase/phosphodiesterase [Stenotrophomonas sp. 24(2023)]WMJ69143.1 EAL domain-containing protein [Stenotrophomonas sp. 24(2023)]